MGRKRKTEDKPKEKEVEPEGSKPLQGVEEQQPDWPNSQVELLDSQPNQLVNTEKLSILMKKTKYEMASPRRSIRIQNTIVNVPNQDLQPVEINLGETEKEDEEEEDGNMEKELPSSTSGEKSMEKKMDYISQLLEAQGKNIEELMAKGLNVDSTNDSQNTRYKNLYTNSRKKIETLTNENHELKSKLEIALSKLEGYEKGVRISAEWMQSLKDLTLVSNFAKTSEQALCHAFSYQDAVVQGPIAASKRKKTLEKKGKVA